MFPENLSLCLSASLSLSLCLSLSFLLLLLLSRCFTSTETVRSWMATSTFTQLLRSDSLSLSLSLSLSSHWYNHHSWLGVKNQSLNLFLSLVRAHWICDIRPPSRKGTGKRCLECLYMLPLHAHILFLIFILFYFFNVFKSSRYYSCSGCTRHWWKPISFCVQDQPAMLGVAVCYPLWWWWVDA